MKKKILLLSSMLVTLILVFFVSLNNTNNENKNVLSNTNKDTEVINSNMITMMYETDAGTGIYEETKDTTWPESGYIFNDNLSGCENGGELEYNSINKTVNLLSNKSDRCYVYFDKYDGVWIDNVSVTNVTGSSVTLDISATSENGSITTYYYSLNDSEEYQETTTNPITINDLNKLTEYKISIYAIDSTNARSNIYEVIVNTTDESGPIIESIVASNVTYNSIEITVNTTSDVGIKRYYYSTDGGENYILSDKNSYVFSSLDDKTTYTFYIYVVDNDRKESEEFVFSATTLNNPSLSNYIIELYNSENEGVNGVYFHDGLGQYGEYEAGDNSYRFAGTNVNNYVCFGTDEVTCPNSNKYRIIGLFEDKVKLIKATSYGDYAWDTGNNWYWSLSTLNNNVLNNTYLSSFSDKYQSQILESIWYSSQHGYSNSSVKETYDLEVVNYDRSNFAKIGLMYIHDYFYAASPNYWSVDLRNYDNVNNNWMFSGIKEWTIETSSMLGNSATISETGLYMGLTINSDLYAVRPTFYISGEIMYDGGSGTESDPIRLEI